MLSNWYVMQVPTRKEHELCNRIKMRVPQELYIDCFVPLTECIYKKEGLITKRVKPLFPGYFFIISENIDEVFLHIRNLPYFARLLHSEFNFIPLKKEEINCYLEFLDGEKMVSMSEGYIEGTKIFIKSGPLKGQEGLIKKINRHKRIATLEMPFMGATTKVNVPLEIINKI